MLEIQLVMVDYNNMAAAEPTSHSLTFVRSYAALLDEQLLKDIRKSKLAKWLNSYILERGLDIKHFLFTD